MRRIFLIGLLVFFSYFLLGCMLVTKFETYSLEPESDLNIGLETDDVTVSLYLDATRKWKLYFPFIFDKTVERNPYRIAIIIKKLIDIEIIQCKIRLNDGKEERVFNLTRQDFEYGLQLDGTPYFAIRPDIYLDDEWESIKEAELIFEFYGIKEGQKTHYMAKKIFKPKFEVLFTNLSMSG
jgi:hypothetical protein